MESDELELPVQGTGLPRLEIEIEYCVPCGLLPAAEETAHALLAQHGRNLAALRLVPSHGGVFRVRVDGEEIFDNSHDAYDLELIRSRAQRVT